uniref:Uncharacterized protein n=1 Tax=Triticum urartu TaxID=4572 RepID=A0A8R7R0P0_TRIUA
MPSKSFTWQHQPNIIRWTMHAVSSAIYFLLLAGEITRLHCIPGETCHYYTGEPSQSENLPTNKNCLSFSKDVAHLIQYTTHFTYLRSMMMGKSR